MFLKNSTKKTKNFLHKFLQSLRSVFCKQYQSLPKTLILNPLSCTPGIHHSQNFDHLSVATIPCETHTMPELAHCGKTREEENESRSLRLVQKMKGLEMMNVGDVDHVLDVEEAIHYYDRLTCPVYVDIVDKFFVDMYREYYFPHISASPGSVSRRLGSNRRISSSRRLGPVVL